MEIEKAIQQLFIEQSWTLSLAESCTGGAIAARLVRNAGASQYFLGSIVAYSNQLKEKLLKVNKDTIALHGAVSEETVTEMVLGTIQTIESDFAVAVSGITGPTGGTQRTPVGTVWIAVAKRGEAVYCAKLPFASGNRKMIIDQSVSFALETLYAYAKSLINKK